MVAHFTFARMMKTRSFSGKKIAFDDYFGGTQCLQQMEIPDLLHICAPCSELPSYISNMQNTICPVSSYPFYLVSYYTKWDTTSWTHSIMQYYCP